MTIEILKEWIKFDLKRLEMGGSCGEGSFDYKCRQAEIRELEITLRVIDKTLENYETDY